MSGGVTIFDLQVAGSDRPRRELPRLVAGALRLAWTAGRTELVTAIALEALTAVGLGALVLLGGGALEGVLAAADAGTWTGLAPDLVALAAVSAVLVIAQALVGRQHQLLSELVARRAQAQILDVVCAVEVAAFDEPAFHDRVARAQAGAMRAGNVVHGLVGLLQAASGIVGSLIALAVLQPLLLPLAALALAPALALSGRQADLFYRFAYTLTPRDRERHYLADLLTQRDAAKEVRAMQLAGFLRARHDRLYAERIDELGAVTNRQLRYALAAGITSAVVIGAALATLVALAIGDELSVASAGAAAGAMVLLGQRLTYGGVAAEQLLESALLIEDYLAFVELAPAAATPPPAPPSRTRRPGRVAAEDVWFAYPGSDVPALRGVSLVIEPGEVVALVGANGSGKTTVAKLLGGLYVPGRGRVLLHDTDTAGPGRAALRADVAVLFQDFLRYALPARDSVALGRHERYEDEAAILAAARAAGAHDDLAALPRGYETQLGPAFLGGVDLSIGQWQKIALARAFFRDASFVILDEPTAALDPRAEHDLFTRTRELFAGRSVLLISHRFSTVRDADRIYVLDAGAVVEHGPHDALVAQGGTYAELFGLQAAAYSKEPT